MPQQPLLQFLLSKNNSGLPQKEFLKKLATIYPWLAPAQFYLLQQMNSAEEAYTKEAAKTSLLFNNPLLLQYQLKYGSTYNNYQPDNEATPSETINNNALHSEEKNEILAIIPAHNVEIENDESTAIKEMPIPIKDIEPLVTNVVETKTEEELMLAENANYDDEALAQETEIEPLRINIPGPVLTNIKESTLTFEPMHLVDYFASQGIKLSDTEQTSDKLGKQLKSFTEWLKVMKKINTPENENSAKIGDISIIAMAEKSNSNGETITESMAEVLIQQGKATKAIEVYKKLSLLNPSKIAYFAAKIEQLKGL